jgi:hypothetical protein
MVERDETLLAFLFICEAGSAAKSEEHDADGVADGLGLIGGEIRW